jgi:hypothetical protein
MSQLLTDLKELRRFVSRGLIKGEYIDKRAPGITRCYCLTGAIAAATHEHVDKQPTIWFGALFSDSRTRAVMQALIPHIKDDIPDGTSEFSFLVQWNDSAATTTAEALDVIDETIIAEYKRIALVRMLRDVKAQLIKQPFLAKGAYVQYFLEYATTPAHNAVPCYCLTGAIVCVVDPKIASLVEFSSFLEKEENHEVLRVLVETIVRNDRENYPDGSEKVDKRLWPVLAAFNDKHTKEQIITLLDETIERIEINAECPPVETDATA